MGIFTGTCRVCGAHHVPLFYPESKIGALPMCGECCDNRNKPASGLTSGELLALMDVCAQLSAIAEGTRSDGYLRAAVGLRTQAELKGKQYWEVLIRKIGTLKGE